MSKEKADEKFRARVRQILEQELKGGSFWDDFKNGFVDGLKMVGSVAKPVLSLVPDPRAKALATGLNVLGLGIKKPRKARKPKAKRGGGVTGGQTRGAKIKRALNGKGVTGGKMKASQKNVMKVRGKLNKMLKDKMGLKSITDGAKELKKLTDKGMSLADAEKYIKSL